MVPNKIISKLPPVATPFALPWEHAEPSNNSLVKTINEFMISYKEIHCSWKKDYSHSLHSIFKIIFFYM